VDDTEFFVEPVTPVARWRKRTASGAVLTAVVLGLQEALSSPKDRPSIVQPAPAGPPNDPIDLYMDPDHPEATVAVIRPWLLR